MAILKQRLNMKTSTGYDTVHLETSSDLVLRSDGTTTVESSLGTVENNISTINGSSFNAASATKLATARTIAISGGAVGTATSFDGSANITIPVTSIVASKIASGTLASGVVATNSTDYTTSRLRNIEASTTDLTAGSSSLTNGTIYLVYE